MSLTKEQKLWREKHQIHVLGLMQQFPVHQRNHPIRRSKGIFWIKCNWCQRRFQVSISKRFIQRYCSCPCRRKEFLSDSAIIEQKNWSVHKMEHYCTSCARPLGFYHAKAWEFHSKLCSSCYLSKMRDKSHEVGDVAKVETVPKCKMKEEE